MKQIPESVLTKRKQNKLQTRIKKSEFLHRKRESEKERRKEFLISLAPKKAERDAEEVRVKTLFQ